MQDLRELVSQETGDEIEGYADIVREERYFCAVLFHCMLQDRDGMQRFLQSCMVDQLHRKVRGVFVEYAMVRDLWNKLDFIPDLSRRNSAKRDFILRALLKGITEANERERAERFPFPGDTLNFNRLFVAGAKPSATHIQSPSRWGVKSFCGSLKGADTVALVKSACMLKWAFNAKPDIVLELEGKGAVCIEAKVESSAGSYASAKSDKDALLDLHATIPESNLLEWLRKHGNQFSVQEYLMTTLLGVRPLYKVYLAPNPISKKAREKLGENLNWKYISWETAFNCFRKTSDGVVRRDGNRLGMS